MKNLFPHIVLLILIADGGALRQTPVEKQRIAEAVTRTSMSIAATGTTSASAARWTQRVNNS